MTKKYIDLDGLSAFKSKADAKYQGKLNTTNVNDGTISKNIGFDSQGNIVKATPSGGGGGSATWGSITGTLSNQTDLYNALSDKESKITSSNKLSASLVDDAQSTNKFVTTNDKNTWNAKQDAIDSSHKLSADLVDDTSTTNKFVTTSDKNIWNGKQDALTTTSVSDGTLDKVIGFDSNGYVVKGTPSGGSTVTFVRWS